MHRILHLHFKGRTIKSLLVISNYLMCIKHILSQKLGAGENNNNRLDLPQHPSTFQDGGYSYVASKPEEDWHMAKVDLQDAYLTMPVHRCLLFFQVLPGQWMQFHSLLFNLYTTPFAFLKVIKNSFGNSVYNWMFTWMTSCWSVWASHNN